jgi:hypothetical protein
MEKLVILGFDVRTPFADQNSSWSKERRSKFLIRPEIPSPISVDSDVWPAFAANPDETYPMQLWGSVSEILARFPETEGPESGAPTIIEIAVITTDEKSLRHWEGMLFKRVRPEKDSALKISPDCLGFDVADRYFVSGLSNCMLSGEELAVSRKDWSKAINTWGLVNDSEAATAFRAVCNRLVPEHAPFEVYRVRKIAVVA